MSNPSTLGPRELARSPGFHPLVWMAWRRLRLEAERACDDAVLNREDAAEYAALLVAVAQRAPAGSRQLLLGMASRGDLSERVMAVLDGGRPRGRVGVTSTIAAIAVAAGLSAAMAPMVVVSAATIAPQPLPVPSPSHSRSIAEPKPEDTIASRAASAVPPVSRQRSLPADASSEAPSAAAASPAAQAATPSGSDRMIVLLFDMTVRQPDDVSRATAAGLRFVDEAMSSSDVLAIVTMSPGLRVLTDFTSRRADLRAILQSSGLADGTAADVGALAMRPIEAADPALEPSNDVRLRNVRTMCETLGAIAQRKAVVYFSGGFSREGGDNQAELRATTSACNRGNVAIYPVDARGLVEVPSVPGVVSPLDRRE